MSDNPFIRDTDVVRVSVYYVRSGTKVRMLDDDADADGRVDAVMRLLSFDEQNKLLSDSQGSDGALRFPIYRTLVLERAMVEWSLEGIECKPENIRMLHPAIGNALADEYMKETLEPPE